MVTVRVSVLAHNRFPQLPRTVAAKAHAGPVSGASGSGWLELRGCGEADGGLARIQIDTHRSAGTV